MTIEVQVSDSCITIPASDWDSLAASRSVFQDLAWYQMTPSIGRLRLLIAYQDDQVAALLPVFILDGPGHYYHIPRDLLCGFRELALLEAAGQPVEPLKQAAAANWFPAAVSVSPYGYRGGLITLQSQHMTEVAVAVAQAADHLCRLEGVRVAAYFYLNETDDLTWITALDRHGARITIVGADCNLDIHWTSLEDYFQSLGSRGRRRRVEHRRALEAADIRWQTMPLHDTEFSHEQAQAMAALFAEAARKHDASTLPAAFYEKILRSWPGRRLLLIGKAAQEDLRSALLVFAKGNTLYPKFYGTAGARGDYFFLTYSSLVDLAIAEGARRIEYGGGSHQAKLLRGARLRWLLAALQIYDNHLSACLDALLPHYEAAKRAYFSQLAIRYQIDHTPPPLPTVTPEDRSDHSRFKRGQS